MTNVTIPAMGESISSGILADWQVNDGDYVESDQVLFELETDKITQECLAEVSGVISIKVAEGEEVDVGAVVATIDESASAPESSETTDAKASEDADADSDAASEAQPESETAGARAQPAQTTATASGSDMPVSPAVHRMAEETGIDPATIAGSGKGGRVTKEDMLKAQQNGTRSAADDRAAAARKMDPEQKAASRPPFPNRPSPAASRREDSAITSSESRTTRKKMTPLRKKIAERLVNATQDAALLTTFNECDMSAVMGMRKRFQEDFVKRYDVKLGFMSFFVKAAVEALKAVPNVNAQIDGDEIVTNHYYDIGVAVGTDKGLIVPVIRHCDQKSFAEIELEIIEKAKLARAGKLTMDDLQGGVFTISNGGIYGSMLSTPLLNMPQSAILGLHNIQERPMAVNGEVVIRPMMYLAVSYDHRLIDGKEAVTFLVNIKQNIEEPSRLLFGI